MTMDKLQATGTVRDVFFSLGITPAINDPKFDCAKAVIDLFDQATITAHVAIYSLTEPQIVDAIIAAHERGVDVAILADATESKSANQAMLVSKPAQAGVDVRLAVRQKALMHNKVGIFDGKTICTGSFNWTNNAERHNDENLPVVDGPDVAADYEKYIFQRILQNETLIRAK